MVQLTEVLDEHFQEGQAGPEEEDDFTDTGTSFLHFYFIFSFFALSSP